MPRSIPEVHRVQRTRKTILWTILSVIAYVTALLLVSTIRSENGAQWISDTLLGQSITMVGGVAALLGPAVVTLGRDTAIVREEVRNNHSTNMREEQDERHDENSQKLDRSDKRLQNIERALLSLAESQHDIRVAITRLTKKSDQQDDRIDDLEQTQPSPPRDVG